MDLEDKKFEENNKIERFKNAMLKELKNNDHKGSILEFNNFDEIITQIEYHKAKLMIAIRLGNKQAAKEYIADISNLLFAFGNSDGLYDDDFVDIQENESFEINKDTEVFKKVTTPTFNQKIDFK
jgi:hypothetical protein